MQSHGGLGLQWALGDTIRSIAFGHPLWLLHSPWWSPLVWAPCPWAHRTQWYVDRAAAKRTAPLPVQPLLRGPVHSTGRVSPSFHLPTASEQLGMNVNGKNLQPTCQH